MTYRRFHRVTMFGREPVSPALNLWLNFRKWIGL